MKKNIIAIITISMFVITSCGTTQNGYSMPQQINEPEVSEITPVYETQVERVNNCDGTNPYYNVSYKTIEAQRASFEVTVGAGGLVTGTPVPSALEVQLEARITAALAKDYGLTAEKNHDITLNNEEGTFLEHTITWKVTRVKGIIEVIYGDGTAQVGFEKIADVELYDRTSKSLGCNGQSTNPSPTITPAVASETEPTATATLFSTNVPTNTAVVTACPAPSSYAINTGVLKPGITVTGPATIHPFEGTGEIAKAIGTDWVPRWGINIPEGTSVVIPDNVILLSGTTYVPDGTLSFFSDDARVEAAQQCWLLNHP